MQLLKDRENYLKFFKFYIKQNHSEIYNYLINVNINKISDKEKNNDSNNYNNIIDNNKKKLTKNKFKIGIF